MKKKENQQKEAGEFIELVRETIRQELSAKDSTAICIVESVNTDGTLNLFVLPDKQTSIKNITNQCRFDFKAGDTALLYLIGNRLSNSFVIAKYNSNIRDDRVNNLEITLSKDVSTINDTINSIKNQINNTSNTEEDNNNESLTYNSEADLEDEGLSISYGGCKIFVHNNILYIIDKTTFSVRETFVSSNQRRTWRFTLPKNISNLLYTTKWDNNDTGTINYMPALYYDEMANYQTLGCQVYLRRSQIGEQEDEFLLTYTGVSNVTNQATTLGYYTNMIIPLVRL